MANEIPQEAVEAAIDVICAPLESVAPSWVDEGERESVRRQVTIVLQAAAAAIRKQERERMAERVLDLTVYCRSSVGTGRVLCLDCADVLQMLKADDV